MKTFYQTEKGKIYLHDDDGKLRELAERVMKNHPGETRRVELDEIVFVVVEGEKGDWLAKCVKTPAMYRMFVKAKFMILFNASLIHAAAPGAQDKIMYHELLHANCSEDKLREHDLIDFKALTAGYGVDWQNNDKRIISLEDLRQYTPWGMPGESKSVASMLEEEGASA